MATAEDLRKDIAAMQNKANYTTNESLESTDRMLRLVTGAREAGVKTTVMLGEQRDQIENVNEGMEDITINMKEIEKHITELEKCCGLCVCPWYRVKIAEKDTKVKGAFSNKDKERPVTNQPNSTTHDMQTPVHDNGRFFQQITGDVREDCMEENLTQITSVLQELKPMATDMGNEISSQNQILDDINDNACTDHQRIQSAHNRLAEVDRNT